MKLKEEQLKLIPYPKQVRIIGGTLSCIPYCENAPRAIGKFLPKKGNMPVCFDYDDGVKEEAYTVEIAKTGITIRACSYAGMLYGVIALSQLCEQFGNELPLLSLYDEPILSHRGAQVSYAQINVSYRADWLKKHIVELAKLHINYLYLYLEWDFAFPSLPPVCPSDMMTPADARELMAFASDYNITIIPECNVLGHSADFLAMQLFDGLKETPEAEESAKISEGVCFCPNNPDTVRLVKRALDDIIDIFSPKIIHIGGDEVGVVGKDKYCRDEMKKSGKIGILLNYFIKIRDYLSSKGVLTGLWGDMLLALSEENAADQNGENYFLEDNLRRFDSLKKDTIIYDWQYVGGSEKSIRFFSQKGFTVISASSVHGCMTSLPTFDQQENIRKLFKDTIRYHLYGGLVTDWINGIGYHAEQSYFNFGAGALMLWSGTDDKQFICGVSREKFERDYLFVRYGTENPALLEYFHLAGDLRGEILRLFAPTRKGVALRKALFYTDNPLWCYVRYITDLDGRLDEYVRLADKLRKLYNRAAKTCHDDGWFYALKIATVVHSYLSRAMATLDTFYKEYVEAAKEQYADKADFAVHLDRCADILKELTSVYSEPVRFADWMSEKLGLEESSACRVRATRRNLYRLIRYMRRLKEDYRPLPTLRRISDSLFDTDRDTWWRMRDFEWIREKGEFKKYDVDLGQFYESLNWE